MVVFLNASAVPVPTPLPGNFTVPSPTPRPVILGLPQWFSLADGKLDVMQVEWG